MSEIKTTPFVIYDYLQSEEDIIGFVEEAKRQAEEEQDDSILHIALLTAIKARALLQFAQKVGVDEQSLLKPKDTKQRKEIINKALLTYA
ncbi:MAG: transcriptional regulator [Neisseriaceae bacterium]|nr:transcriptional regulator [Neisseriaceae bacterium]